MLITRTRLYTLPEYVQCADGTLVSLQDAYPDFRVVTRTYNEGPVEELLAYLAGEEITPSLLLLVPHLSFTLPSPQLKPFPIVTKDGHTIANFSLGTLRRNFQMVDDFLKDFPDAKSVMVPYGMEEVAGALSCIVGSDARLCDVLPVVHFLNPKDAMYYFRFSLRGMSLEVLKGLTTHLTEQNRFDVLAARRRRDTEYPLPREGLGWRILAAFLELQSDCSETLVECFADCPSYLLAGYAEECFDTYDYGPLKRLLLTADFRDDNSSIPSESYCLNLGYNLINYIQSLLLGGSLTWEEYKRLLSMLGLKSKVLGLTRVEAPYRMTLRQDGWSDVIKHIIMDNVERVCSDSITLAELERIL